MKAQSEYNVIKGNLNLRLMAGFKGFQNVEIPEIPKEWTKFPKSEDEWCGFDLPDSENSSGCLYKAKAGSIFDPHEHLSIKEHMTVMNNGGSMRVTIQNKGVFVVNYPNAIAIPEGLVHSAEFLTDTIVLIVWHPRFKKGWEAKFKEKDSV